MFFRVRISVRTDWEPRGLKSYEENLTIAELTELLESVVGQQTIVADVSLWNEEKLQLLQGKRQQGQLAL